MEKMSEKTGIKLAHKTPYEEKGPLFNIFLQQTELFFHRDLFISDVLSIVKNSMQAQVCCVRLLEENRLSPGVSLGYHNLTSRNAIIPDNVKVREWMQKKELLIVPNLDHANNIPGRIRKQWLKEGFKSCLAMPLFYRGGPAIGILAAFYTRPIRRRTVKSQKLVSLGEMFAFMLHNTVLDEDILELKQLIKNVVEFTTDSIIVTDQLGKILYASRQAQRLFRRKSLSLAGEYIFYLDRSKQPVFEDAFKKVNRRQSLVSFELSVQISQGRRLYLEASVARLPVRRRRREILLWLFKDKTSLYLAEKNLDQKKKELEEFVYSVSHDLKSPIVSAQGYASLLREEAYDGLMNTHKHYFERIVANIEQMERAIQELLELSRAGKVDTEMSRQPLGKIVKEALEDFQYQIEDKKVRVVLPDRLPRLECHTRNMKLVFSNLMSNAIKFLGDQKKPVLEIGLKRRLSEYEFFVKDNGIGIAENEQDRIFNAFYRSNQIKNVEGTGIGLAVAKKIVEEQGGHIRVESNPGKGSIFYFSLPRANHKS